MSPYNFNPFFNNSDAPLEVINTIISIEFLDKIVVNLINLWWCIN